MAQASVFLEEVAASGSLPRFLALPPLLEMRAFTTTAALFAFLAAVGVAVPVATLGSTVIMEALEGEDECVAHGCALSAIQLRGSPETGAADVEAAIESGSNPTAASPAAETDSAPEVWVPMADTGEVDAD